MRHHPKSHTDCVQCRKSRVKCDEKQPACTRCLRRDDDCTYTVIRFYRCDSAGSATSACRQSLQPTSTVELELMHQFTLHTSKTCGQSMMPQSWWQESLPLLAIRHDHLLYALFAFTSLHLASLRTGKYVDYVVTSASYRDRAVRILSHYFSPDQLEPEQLEACFWSSCMIGLVHLAEHQLSPESQQLKGAKCMLLELARLWRGADSVGEMSGAVGGAFRHSNHYPESRRTTTDSPRPIDDEWSSTLSKAKERVENAFGLDLDTRGLYVGAIDDLGVAVHESTDQRTGAILSWIACLDNKILEVLAQDGGEAVGNIVATFVLLLYGPALHLIRDLWYIRDLGEKLVEELTPKIPLKDRKIIMLVNWAREQVCG